MQLKDMGEIKLLDQIRNNPLVNDIGDDCAVLNYTGDQCLLVTTDMLVEGVHFSLQTNSWSEIGQKAVQVNLSDIAAMGGIPRQLFVSLGLPEDVDDHDVQELYAGFGQAGVPISGGDVVHAKEVIINICVLGDVEKSCLCRRSGAAIGDQLAVTGLLGGHAASGYTLVPHARLREGRQLAQSGVVTAMTDISDGLARSIMDIAAESGVGVQPDESRIPIAPGATLKQALQGGEDYELLFSFKAGAQLPIAATVIGEIVKQQNGLTFEQKGYEHFKDYGEDNGQ